MKDVLMQFAAYNKWANNQMAEKMLSLTEEQIDRPVTSSFQSVRATVHHVWSAEDVWLQRLMNVPEPVWAEGIFKGSFADACSNWQVISTALEHFIDNRTEEELVAACNYKDMQGRSHQSPVNHILMHVFNHGTYHRGQLVTMMRKLGETTIPRTDFIVFSRLMG